MKLRSFNGLLMAVLLVVGYSFAGNVEYLKPKTYHAKTGDFSLTIPAEWEIQEDTVIQGYKIPLSVVRPTIGTNDIFRDNLNVTAEPISASMDTGAYLDANVKTMKKSLNGMKVLKTGDLKGVTGAKYLIYTHLADEPEGLLLKGVAFFYTKGSKGYVLTCTSAFKNFPRYFAVYWYFGKSFVLGN